MPARLDSLKPGNGFTLVELLTSMAILGILAAITLAAVGSVREQARAVECASRLRNLGHAFHLYANDNQGAIPPSWHSAGARREQNWAWQTQDYLHPSSIATADEWATVFDQFYRCPTEPSRSPQIYSYGLNVYFELNPLGDSYEGSPATRQRLEDLPAPSRTVLLAEPRPIAFGDHLMAHQWTGVASARNAIHGDRHQDRANYLFADGNVQRLTIEQTFDPQNGTNLWHPSR